jgi:hypothetical protein
MRPLALSDDQMTAIMRCAEPLAPSARASFLVDVADALQGRELGDGLVGRVCAEVAAALLERAGLVRGDRHDALVAVTSYARNGRVIQLG